MSNSKEILDRINSVKTMKQITQTMKLISISKFTKNKVELEKVRKYKSTLKNILEECKIENIDKTTCCKRLLIPISGNRGFCGAFNNNIFNLFNFNYSCRSILERIINKYYTFIILVHYFRYNLFCKFIDISKIIYRIIFDKTH